MISAESGRQRLHRSSQIRVILSISSFLMLDTMGHSQGKISEVSYSLLSMDFISLSKKEVRIEKKSIRNFEPSPRVKRVHI